MRHFLVIFCVALAGLAGPMAVAQAALAQSAPAVIPAAPGAMNRPDAAVYQGQTLKMSMASVIKEINALSPIAYTDTQTTKVFSTVPAQDIEKIIATKTGAAIEFWSDDSLDGMARESLVNVNWADVCCKNIYVTNDPETGADYQVQAFTGGNNLIANFYRDVDDTGHLAAEQMGDPADMFSFDNAGDFTKAKHVADLLTTLVALAAPVPAPVPVASAPDPGAAEPHDALAMSDQTQPEVVAAALAVPASSFQGNFAVRVGPPQKGAASVDVVNISGQTRNVNIAVVDCQNISKTDCGSKFSGPLGAGMTLSFSIKGDDVSQPWKFRVNAD